MSVIVPETHATNANLQRSYRCRGRVIVILMLIPLQAASWSLVKTISLQLLLDNYWLPTTLAASTISVAVILAVLNRRTWIAKLGCMLAVIVWCSLILQQVLTFAGFPMHPFAIMPTALQTITFATTSSFICALALRLRSYRIVRI